MLVVSGVAKQFAGSPALRNVSLEIKSGEFFAILGPSGCGKTTLLRLIAGLESPDSGDLLLDGKSIRAVPPQERPFNTVFQSYALFPHLDVRRNVGFGLAVARVPREERENRVSEALRLVRLEGYDRRRVTTLSGGEQQRVALARAIVNRPRVLLLDEPMSALDLKLRRAMQQELAQLHQKLGMTFVLVTHDQDEAMGLASRIAVMDGGRIAQIGSPEDLYLRPADPFVGNFIGAVNSFAGQAETLPGGALALRCSGSGLVLALPRGASFASGGAVGRGDRIELLVRPQMIRLGARSTPESESEVHLPGTVTARAFKGQAWELSVRLLGDSSRSVLACRPWTADDREDAVPKPGAEVMVSWAMSSAAIVRE